MNGRRIATVTRDRAAPGAVRRAWRIATRPFTIAFIPTLLEVLAVALVIESIALAWTRIGTPAPWPELLAFISEHSLWLLGALLLRPAAGSTTWRVLRVPLFGALAGTGFALLGRELALIIQPARSFFQFQALGAPDPTRLFGTGFLDFVLTATLRFVLAYTFRAVWLEGGRRLQWRLTGLALGGGVFATAIIATLPNLVAVVQDPSRTATGDALRDAEDLAASLQTALGLGLSEYQLNGLLEYLESAPGTPRLSEGEPAPSAATAAFAGRGAVILSPDGTIIAANQAHDHPTAPEVTAWQEVAGAARTGRCRALIAGANVLAGCPAFGPAGRVRVVAGVIRPLGNEAALADVVSQVTHDLTSALDNLSRAFAPIFLGVGLIGYLASRRLTGRLDEVVEGTDALRSGALSVRVPVDGHDEIARLAGGFNTMADRLQASVADLEREKAQVEALLRANRTLTASASHELRTPIAVMRAHLESAEMRDATLGADEARVLTGEVMRLERLVDDLFALSRAELGRLELRLDHVNVAEVASNLASSLRPLAASRSLTLIDQVPAELPPVLADRARLHQALANLVHNALRYTPEGGLILVDARHAGSHVEVSVADTGIGIAETDLEHIFEPFYRADPARARETGGAGLGLALVKQLVVAMGGDVRAESEPRHGSRFTLLLPVANDA